MRAMLLVKSSALRVEGHHTSGRQSAHPCCTEYLVIEVKSGDSGRISSHSFDAEVPVASPLVGNHFSESAKTTPLKTGGGWDWNAPR